MLKTTSCLRVLATPVDCGQCGFPGPAPGSAEPAGWVAFLGVHSVLTSAAGQERRAAPETLSPASERGAENAASGGSPSRSEEDRARLEPPAGEVQASSGRQLEVHSSGPQLVNNEWGLPRQNDQCVLGSHRAAPERLRGTAEGFQSEPEALGPGLPWPRLWGHCGWCRLPRGKGETLPCCSFSEHSLTRYFARCGL